MKRLKNLSVVLVFAVICSMFIVGCSSFEIVLSVKNAITTPLPGETIELIAEIKSKNSEDKDKEVTYAITKGENYATIDGKFITINQDASAGQEIKVQASSGEVESNEVKIVVGSINLESIAITTNSYSVASGNSAKINVTINPSNVNTTQKYYELRIIEGQEFATVVVDKNEIKVNDNAEPNNEIKVQAVSGNKSSNIISIFTAEEDSGVLYTLDFEGTTDESVILDINSINQLPKLQTKIYGGNNEVSREVRYVITSGSEFINLTQEANNIASFEIKGHGTATVKVELLGTTISEEVTVNAIVPPTTISLHEVLEARSNAYRDTHPTTNQPIIESGIFAYAYAKNSPLKLDLSFLGTSAEQSVSTDVVVKFIKESIEDATLGEYDQETKEITFNQTGTITVRIESNSGSRQETTRNYTFEVNDGVNVSTFEELKTAMESKDVKNNIINITVFNKPVSTSSTYKPGFSIVPQHALLPKSDQTKPGVAAVKINATVGKEINGNQHLIDLSNLAYFDTVGLSGEFINISPLDTDTVKDNMFDVKIQDLFMKGNAPINFAGSIEADGNINANVHERGLQINKTKSAFVAKVDLNNIRVSDFSAGIRLNNANGVMQSSKVENCYVNGMETSGCILTLRNMSYGPCGATGIEITPDGDTMAGVGQNENQTIIYEGYINSTNNTSGDTRYFSVWKGGLVSQIISGLFTQYNATATNNILNRSSQKFNLVALIFSDPTDTNNPVNNTILAFEKDGDCIDINEMGAFDKTHKYVLFDFAIFAHADKPELKALAGLGRLIFLNYNYGRSTSINPA